MISELESDLVTTTKIKQVHLSFDAKKIEDKFLHKHKKLSVLFFTTIVTIFFICLSWVYQIQIPIEIGRDQVLIVYSLPFLLYLSIIVLMLVPKKIITYNIKRSEGLKFLIVGMFLLIVSLSVRILGQYPNPVSFDSFSENSRIVLIVCFGLCNTSAYLFFHKKKTFRFGSISLTIFLNTLFLLIGHSFLEISINFFLSILVIFAFSYWNPKLEVEWDD